MTYKHAKDFRKYMPFPNPRWETPSDLHSKRTLNTYLLLDLYSKVIYINIDPCETLLNTLFLNIQIPTPCFYSG